MVKNYAGTSSKYNNASTPTKEFFAWIPSNEQKVGKRGGINSKNQVKNQLQTYSFNSYKSNLLVPNRGIKIHENQEKNNLQVYKIKMPHTANNQPSRT